jgi:hypothetical protein
MTHAPHQHGSCSCCRRDFLQAAGAAAGALAFLSGSSAVAEPAAGAAEAAKSIATVRGAFVYPPSQTLRDEGYWSWPGSSFDAEGHQRQYADQIRKIEAKLGMKIAIDERPLDQQADVTRFIEQVKQSPPDGLLLIPFKKGHWGHVTRIVEETGVPAVVLATLGVLLVDHLNQLHRKPGVHLIASMDNFAALADGMTMIRTAHRMKESLLVSITGSEPREAVVAGLGTHVRSVPLERFVELYRGMEATDAVRALAASYRKGAREVVEPTDADLVDAAKTYFVLKEIIEAEKGDAVMMNCLPGLRKPHRHAPPCMGFMSLRDEGLPAGCQADLNATLTLMLVQELFGRPGFQQNASMETVANHYFGAHCTSASKMNGPGGPAEPYILRSHAEAGWGCVPQVLFPEGQAVTLALYQAGEKPRMLIYSGNVVRCYPKAAGGCRTNVEMTVNEVADACDVQGMHQIIFYGNSARQLRAFCQLYGIEAVS